MLITQLPVIQGREGDPCPSCLTGSLMESTDGQPLIACDSCGAEFSMALSQDKEATNAPA